MKACTLVSVALVLGSFVDLSYQLEAVLCYRREVELKCGMQIPLKKGALMSLGSVTVYLSANAEDLRTKNEDGRSCKEVATDCTLSMRASNLDTFPPALKTFYQMIEQECSNKTSCLLSMPDWDALDIASFGSCDAREDGSTYHFKAVYLDLPCYFPRPTTTAAPTTAMEGGDVEFTNHTNSLPDVNTDEEDMGGDDNSTTTTAEMPAEPKEKDDGEVQKPPPPVGPNPRGQGDRGRDNSARSLYSTGLIATLMLAVVSVITTV